MEDGPPGPIAEPTNFQPFYCVASDTPDIIHTESIALLCKIPASVANIFFGMSALSMAITVTAIAIFSAQERGRLGGDVAMWRCGDNMVQQDGTTGAPIGGTPAVTAGSHVAPGAQPINTWYIFCCY